MSRQCAQEERCSTTTSRSLAGKAFSANAESTSASGCSRGTSVLRRSRTNFGSRSMVYCEGLSGDRRLLLLPSLRTLPAANLAPNWRAHRELDRLGQRLTFLRPAVG